MWITLLPVCSISCVIKAIVFYAADHGESINEREHLRGRRAIYGAAGAIPCSDMLVWMSDKYLASPQHAQMFAHLKQQAEIKVPHVVMWSVRYDNGLLGIYTSPDGGIIEQQLVPYSMKVAAK